MSKIGVVIIGRNESPRLGACIDSVRAGFAGGGLALVEIVYVDSSSTDGSVDIGREMGAHVIVLEPASAPAPKFTAARGRNAGAEALLQNHPEIEFIQFLDGDTVMDADWLAAGAAYLEENPQVAVVSGALRERFPQASVYNQLADVEWNTPTGEASEFGGNALIRASTFHDLHGFNPNFVAGEEPELAARMRLAGFKIVRMDAAMALHDLHMTKFRQWWRRTRRSGYALAQLYETHGAAPLFFYRRQYRSTLFWTSAMPCAIVALAWASTWWALLLLPLAYMYLAMRIVRYRRRRGDTAVVARRYAMFTVLAKFPQLLGILMYYGKIFRGRDPRVIEEKKAPEVSISACAQKI